MVGIYADWAAGLPSLSDGGGGNVHACHHIHVALLGPLLFWPVPIEMCVNRGESISFFSIYVYIRQFIKLLLFWSYSLLFFNNLYFYFPSCLRDAIKKKENEKEQE